MTIMHFKGRIMPQAYVFFVGNLPRFQQYEESLDLTTNFTVVIADSAFDVECEVSSYDEGLISYYSAKALELVRTIVDLYSFASAVGLSVHMEQFISPNGLALPIISERVPLRGLATAFDLSQQNVSSDLTQTLLVVLSDSQIFMAVSDLVACLSTPRLASINCGRAIEAVRSLMTPSKVDRKLGWVIMQNRLNVTQAYLKLITDFSTSGRHGERFWPLDSPIDEVIRRSWIVMNRFLEYRKEASIPLQPDKFPLLEG